MTLSIEYIDRYDMDRIRSALMEHISPEDGENLRAILHKNANDHYVRKYTLEEYLEFMNEHTCSFSVNGAQETNSPYYFTMFCLKSQHVRGDCVEECLDIAIDK